MPTFVSLLFKPSTSSPLKTLIVIFSFIFVLYLLHHPFLHAPPPTAPTATAAAAAYASTTTTTTTTTTTSIHHILFSIASSSRSFQLRKPYVRLWYTPNTTRAFVFIDHLTLPEQTGADSTLPPVVISGDTSHFPYTYPRGLRSAIRVARIVKEAVERNNESNIRWFVFGDDDTVFFVDNLVMTLSKYDHDRWFYVGGISESYEQTVKYSFDMAFGGGGFAISRSLARVLARVLDSCLVRYAHLYGSDARVYSCVAELGVGLTHEPGFHQVDVRGNLFGLLSAHPLSPLVSLHHLDSVDPIFPNMNRTQALEHLFKAIHVDPARVLQQTVCYDQSTLTTISVAWGYAIQVYEGNQLLLDLLPLQKTFMPWIRNKNINSSHYMFRTREFPKDPCRRPAIFFLESIVSDKKGVWSNYKRHNVGNCVKTNAITKVELITVFSKKLKSDIEEMKAPRRQCCDVLPSVNESMVINIRHCGVDELISMHL